MVVLLLLFNGTMLLLMEWSGVEWSKKCFTYVHLLVSFGWLSLWKTQWRTGRQLEGRGGGVVLVCPYKTICRG